MTMKQNTKQKITGIVLVMIILLSGTFAFLQLNQTAFTADQIGVLPGGRIHDVFQIRSDDDNSGERNKNVFAENFGDVPIAVRVQFHEFLELNGQAIMNDDLYPNVRMNINNITTWGLFQADRNLVRRENSVAGRIGEEGIVWRMGQSANDVKVFMPTFNHVNRRLTTAEMTASYSVDGSLFHDQSAYRFSEASGRAVDGLAGAININPLDGNVNAVGDFELHGTQTGYENHNGTKGFWDLYIEGAPASLNVNDRLTAERYFIDNSLTPAQLVRVTATHYTQETLVPAFGGIMSLEQWRTAGMPEGNFWIMDTENPGGWFYWNGMLPAGEATSLLIDSTMLPQHPSLDYIIRINAQFFTEHNMPEIGIDTPNEEMSEQAALIFNRDIDNDQEDYEDEGELEETGFLIPTKKFDLTQKNTII